MTREEYLQKMQEYREDLQNAAKKNRETLDVLKKEHIENKRKEIDRYHEALNKERDEHLAHQHNVERMMNDLKMEWEREHPIKEVKVVE